jgi:hypothetical protein
MDRTGTGSLVWVGVIAEGNPWADAYAYVTLLQLQKHTYLDIDHSFF